MIIIENENVSGIAAAVRGARNPMNSWDSSDSYYTTFSSESFFVGKKDLVLLTQLANAGPDHGKFLRMIHVSADITAPLYWWKEFDTYKVGTVANSCSTMHTIHKTGITKKLFSFDSGFGFKSDYDRETVDRYIELLEDLRVSCKPGDDIWRTLIQLLPESFNQLRTVDLNYTVLKNIYWARKDHKLTEWHDFCDWIRRLPYAELLINHGGLVRCRDCVNGQEDTVFGGIYCNGIRRDDDFYCRDGERKDD